MLRGGGSTSEDMSLCQADEGKVKSCCCCDDDGGVGRAFRAYIHKPRAFTMHCLHANPQRRARIAT